MVSGNNSSGSSSSGSANTSRTETGATQSIPYGFAGQGMDDIMRRGGALSYGTPTMYQGQTYANFDPLQTQSQNQLVNYANQGLGGNYDPARQAWQGMLTAPADVASNPHIREQLDQQRNQAGLSLQQLGAQQQGAYGRQSNALGRDYNQMTNNLNQQYANQTRLMNRNFNENIMPGIDMGAVAAGEGALGSSRDSISRGIAARGQAEGMQNLAMTQQNQLGGLAQQGTGRLSDMALQNQMGMEQQGAQSLQSLANSGANSYMNAYNQSLGQQRYGLGFSPTIADMGRQSSDILSGVGSQRQAMDQQGINEGITRHDFAQNAPWTNLERYQGILGGGSPYAGSRSYGTFNSNVSSNDRSNSYGSTGPNTAWLGAGAAALGTGMEYYGKNYGNSPATVSSGSNYMGAPASSTGSIYGSGGLYNNTYGAAGSGFGA